MNDHLKIEVNISFKRNGRGARREATADEIDDEPAVGRLPKVTKLMALAIRFERLLAQGAAADYAELARLGHVTRARLTQIMNLRLLAPDIQEAILFLPAITSGARPDHSAGIATDLVNAELAGATTSLEVVGCRRTKGVPRGGMMGNAKSIQPP